MSLTHPVKEDLIQAQILQAAKQLFQQHGLYKVTMDDVAKAVGKGRSSLYYYYKSRDEIFDAVVDEEIGDLIREISLAVEKVTTVEEKIRVFGVTKLKTLKKRRAFFRTLGAGLDAEEMNSFTKTKQSVHRRIMQQEGILLRQILHDGIHHGEVRAMGQREEDVLVFVLLSSIHGLKREMVIEDDFRLIEPSMDTLSHTLIHGLKKG